MKYELLKLPYNFEALEPYIDARTMEIHYTKHHQSYADKFNAVMEKYPQLQNKSAEDLLRELEILPVAEDDRAAIRKFGGGYVNHNLYWKTMGPQKEVEERLKTDIEKTFGSTEEFKKIFTEKAKTLFGSGWVWLTRDEQGGLQIYGLPNQDTPWMRGHTPILAIDLWEHAYYLKYQNRRDEYIESWWKVVRVI